MAPPQRNESVADSVMARCRRSASQLTSNAINHSPPHSSPLCHGLTYGNDVFSASETESDLSNPDEHGDTHAAAADSKGNMRHAHQQQTVYIGGRVASLSTGPVRIPESSLQQMSPLDALIQRNLQSMSEQRRLASQSAAHARAQEAYWPHQTLSPPATPQPPEETDHRARAPVHESIRVASPVDASPDGGELYQIIPIPGQPPLGNFHFPGNSGQAPATPILIPFHGNNQHCSRVSTANLAPIGFFAPTGRTLLDQQNDPDPSGTAFSRCADQSDSTASPALPPLGTFYPVGQHLRAQHQSQRPPEPRCPHTRCERVCGSLAPPVNPVASGSASASSHTPISHIHTQNENISRLDFLAAVALGQMDAEPFPSFVRAPSSAIVCGLASDNAIASPSTQSAIAKSIKPSNTNASNNVAPSFYHPCANVPAPAVEQLLSRVAPVGFDSHAPPLAAPALADEQVPLPMAFETMAGQAALPTDANTLAAERAPLSPAPRIRGCQALARRRRAHQRCAALPSQELSRKMTTKSDIRKMLKKNADKATANAFEGNKGTAEAGPSNRSHQEKKEVKEMITLIGKPFIEMDIGDHVFRDKPHKDSVFPRPKPRALQKATVAAGDPHEPEFAKRHAERYEKRNENNTIEWPDSGLRETPEGADTYHCTIQDNMAQMIGSFKELEALHEAQIRSEKAKAAVDKEIAARRKAQLRNEELVRVAMMNDEEYMEYQQARAAEAEKRARDSGENDAATVTDANLTETDEDGTVIEEDAQVRASLERSKLLSDAISVWEIRADIREHYHRLDCEKTQRDLRRVNNLFNSRLSNAARDGFVFTPTPRLTCPFNTGVIVRNYPIAQRANSGDGFPDYTGEPFFSSAPPLGHLSKARDDSDHFNMPLTDFDLPCWISPESFGICQDNSSQNLNFCMPNPCPLKEEKPSINFGLGLDGACDAPDNMPEAMEDKKKSRGYTSGAQGPSFEEIDFEIGKPVPTLPHPSTTDKGKEVITYDRPGPDSPLNTTSKPGDDPFYYDPRFDPADAYHGILHGLYPRYKRYLVPGDAESRARAAEAKKREEEAEAQRREDREEAIRKDPIETLLRHFMGDSYTPPDF